MKTDATGLDRLLARYLPEQISFQKRGKSYAPANIALSKYWGKRDKPLNLPCNSSLSISLGAWGSTTSVEPSTSGKDEIVFNGKVLNPADVQARKVFVHIDLFRRGKNIPCRIETSNTIPTAAGLASSASGFAALTLALDRAFDLRLPRPILSMIARLGSGSAARSLWHGFVRWDRGIAEDGSDSVGHPLKSIWPNLRMAIVPVDTGPKKHTSRDGMTHTTATSPLFPAWPDQAERDCAEIEIAIKDRNLQKLGEIAESNALAMHATMIAARPSLNYLTAKSWQVLTTLRQARENGLSAYATMDAGANVKLIFEADQTDDVKGAFPQATVIAPFETQPDL